MHRWKCFGFSHVPCVRSCCLADFTVIITDRRCPHSGHLMSYSKWEMGKREEMHDLKLGNRICGYVRGASQRSVSHLGCSRWSDWRHFQEKVKWEKICVRNSCLLQHPPAAGLRYFRPRGGVVRDKRARILRRTTDPALKRVPERREVLGDTSFHWRRRRRTERKESRQSPENIYNEIKNVRKTRGSYIQATLHLSTGLQSPLLHRLRGTTTKMSLFV